MFLVYAIFAALLAWLTSVLTIGFGLYSVTRTDKDIKQMVDVVGGLASALLWFVAAYGASSLEHTSSAGVTTVNPATSAAYLFAVFGIFMIVIAVVRTAILLDVTELSSGRQDTM